jgi:uncharacterized protein YciI
MPHYAYRVIPKRPDFIRTMSEADRAIIGRHWNYLQEQFAAGKINVVGRCEHGEYGLTIVEVPSPEEARQIMQGDPAVAEGLMDAEMHEFRLLLFRPPA